MTSSGPGVDARPELPGRQGATWLVDATPEGAVEVRNGDGIVFGIAAPVLASALGGRVVATGYSDLERPAADVLLGRHTWQHGAATLSLLDEWRAIPDGVLLHRRLSGGGEQGHERGPAGKDGTGASPDGVQLGLEVSLPGSGPARFLAPGMAYSPGQWAAGGAYSYCDTRLAYPVVAAHDGDRVLSLRRETPARFDEVPRRSPGQTRFVQRTDIGSIGFRTPGDVSVSDSGRGEPGQGDPGQGGSRLGDAGRGGPELETAALVAAWPYAEGDVSAMLDHAGSPASALFPLDAALDVSVTYRLSVAPATTYTDAVRCVLTAALEHAEPAPTPHGVSLADSVDLRLDSAAKTFAESAGGLAGFVLNFDPERGYDSEAKAFGASFAEHSMGGSHGILEYGFTGRQLNLAYLLARRGPASWLARGAAVVDGFVSRMALPSGWVHTLYDLAADQPLYACGDPRGTVMHYLGPSEVAGTYTRMMTEAGSDLLLNIGLHRQYGADVGAWTAAAQALGDFLVRNQEDDGSWFRAYAPDGTPIVDSDWFGHRSGSAKTATAAVVPFLLDLADDDAAAHSDAADRYRAAAARAGDFVIRHVVEPDEYRGGTLDNPNLVDKEAAFLAMRALVALHDRGGAAAAGTDWVAPAVRAAWTALSWHSLVEVPLVADTPLGAAGVRSVGWGGINSVWGVGVTDIYSLFFLADLDRLGEVVGEPAFGRVAELVACSSLELLAVPGRLHGFTDTGMQPEGIAFVSQGADDGLIGKGDTWGGLAWPYTAGTYGLGRYLDRCTDPARPPGH